MLDEQPTPRRLNAQRVTAPPRREPRPTDPCAMVIFGAGGDLTKRLVVPALYNLGTHQGTAGEFALIGVDLAQGNAESWREHLYEMLKSYVGNSDAVFDVDKIDQKAWIASRRKCHMCPRFYQARAVREYSDALDEAEKAHGTQGNVISTRRRRPILWLRGRPTWQSEAHRSGQGQGREAISSGAESWSKSRSAIAWIRARVKRQHPRTLDENQIFRIDHFLGKDTVQSIMAFPFRQWDVEPIWNRDRIDHVQITVAETVGVEQRGKFYEATGALRDMVPNHVFTLLSILAMEPPTGFDAAAICTRGPKSSHDACHQAGHGGTPVSMAPARW